METDRVKAFFSHPVTAVLLLLAAPMGFYHWTQRTAQEQERALKTPVITADSVAAMRDFERIKAPGVRPDEFRSAHASGVKAGEEVIGVIVDGQPRAYLVEAMNDLRRCVVNDVVGDRPITVIYAARAGVSRVLTPREGYPGVRASGKVSPLDLGVEGLRDGLLFLSYRGREVVCDDDIFGLTDFPYAWCSWGVWKAAYPHTDIYTGDLVLGAE